MEEEAVARWTRRGGTLTASEFQERFSKPITLGVARVAEKGESRRFQRLSHRDARI
jgi:hypothetical protein